MKTGGKLMMCVVMLAVSVMCASGARAAQDSGAPLPVDQKETKESKPNPQDMQDLTMAMAPAFGMMAQNMMDGIYTGLAKPETATKLARFMKNYHTALLAEGFSKEEAIQIIRAFAVPSMGGK